MPDFYPYQPTGTDGAKASLHNCTDIFHKYCSKALRQSLNMDELYIYEEQEIRALGPELRKVLCAVRFPTPDGYVTVLLDEVNEHWGDVTEEQVAGTQFASKTRADFERCRFLYTVVVRMSQAGWLDASLDPSASALAGTRSAVDAQKLADELVLRDNFAPDGKEAQSPATKPSPEPSTSAQESASPLMSEPSPYKAESAEVAQRKLARQEVHQARQAQAQEEAAQRKRERQEAHQVWQGQEQAQVERRKREQQQMPPTVSPMPPMPPARWLQLSSPPPPPPPPPPLPPMPLAPPPASPPAPPPVPPSPHQQQQQAASPPANSDPKTQLNGMAQLRWRTAGTDSSVLRYASQTLPSGDFVATVTLGRCNSGTGESRTGGEAKTKKGAEQLAAALAVTYLEQLPSGDQ